MKKFLFLFMALIACWDVHSQSAKGLIAHWKMDGSALDASGNGHHGSSHYLQLDTGRDGVYGHAYYFNGNNSYISASPSASFNLTNYSICATVKVKGFNTGICHANMLFVRGGTSSSSTGSYALEFKDKPTTGYDCYTLDSTKETFWSYTSGLSVGSLSKYYYAPPIVKERWYKVVATFNDTSYRIYVDGVLKAKADIVTPGVPMGKSSDSVFIGLNASEAADGYPYPFKGVIDDIKLYGRAITDSEAAHYGDTCGLITKEPVKVSTSLGAKAVYSLTSTISGATYQWQADAGSGFVNLTNSGPYSGVFTPTLTISSVSSSLSGNNYRCIVSNSWGCEDTSAMALLTTGIYDISSTNLAVSLTPNPVSTMLFLELEDQKNEGAVIVINHYGTLAGKFEMKEGKAVLDVAELPAGVYVVKVVTSGGIAQRKFVKL